MRKTIISDLYAINIVLRGHNTSLYIRAEDETKKKKNKYKFEIHDLARDRRDFSTTIRDKNRTTDAGKHDILIIKLIQLI